MPTPAKKAAATPIPVQLSATEFDQFLGTFQNAAKVVDSLIGKTWYGLGA